MLKRKQKSFIPPLRKDLPGVVTAKTTETNLGRTTPAKRTKLTPVDPVVISSPNVEPVMKHDDYESSLDEEKYVDDSTVDIKQGFTMASGKPIVISNEAMAKAEMMMQSVDKWYEGQKFGDNPEKLMTKTIPLPINENVDVQDDVQGYIDALLMDEGEMF